MTAPADSRPGRVLVLGHFGGLNVGDDLMLDGFMSAWPFAVAELTVVAKDAGLVAHADWRTVRVIPMSARAVWQAVGESEAVVMVGGTHFHDDYELRRYLRHARYLLRYLAVFAVARARRIPVALISQGIGPLRRASARLMAALALRLATRVTVRDESSAQWARRLAGVRPQRAFDLAGLAPLAVGRLRRSTVHPGMSTLGISLLDFSQFESIERSTEEIAATIGRACALLGEEGMSLRVELLGLRGGDREPDAPALMVLREHLRGIGVRSEDWVYEGDLRAFIERFAQVDVHLVCRLHAAILAHLLEIPFAALAYHEKVTAFASDVGLPSQLVLHPDEFTAEELARSIEAASQTSRRETRAAPDARLQAATHVNAVVETMTSPKRRSRRLPLAGTEPDRQRTAARS